MNNLMKNSMANGKRRGPWAWLCLAIFILVGLGASEETARAQALGADDVLSVTVLLHPELSVETVTVSPAGTINLPVAGQISVAGKTPQQVSREIARRLNARVVNPEVTVSLRQAGGRRVFVLGGVTKPGVYEVRAGWRVSEVLAAAGGVAGRLDETRATLARPSQTPVAIDLTVALGNPSSPQNRAVRAGDVLVVTALDPQYVTVSGDVNKPDIYPLRRARRLLDVLVAASGLKQPSTQSRGFLLRRSQRIPLDLPAAMKYTDYRANIALLPGDLIVVEAIAPLNVTVNGLVRTPGNYPLPEGSGVLQAIAQAGGQTTTAEKTVVSVRRGDLVLPVDVTRAAFDPNADVRLQNGDLVQLSEPQIIRVQITGQVRSPGELRIAPQSTVLDAIVRAGGLNLLPHDTRISVVRVIGGRREALGVDATSLMEGRDLRQNALLEEGDVITVTNVRLRVVFVSGEVNRPGAYDLRAGEGVAELLTRAGGPTAQASLRRVQIERDGTTRSLDTLNVLRQGENKPDFLLREGDFVVVPQNMARVLVTQEVNRPGYVSIPEDRALTVGEALTLAGGPRDRAKFNEVLIFRRIDGGLKSRVVRLDKIEGGDLGLNQTLVAGDILYVPQGRPSRSSAAIGSIVSTLSTLRFLGGF
ncbi:MAG: SLBB domain-containing protein [Armatimonadetes bacterium]|nr:SLBB domain-containing protein [Armatimonadota bacterium]